jgi:hypothetical protein
LLSSLEDQRANLAARRLLGFELHVDVALRAIEDERNDGTLLGADTEMLTREGFEIGIERALTRLRLPRKVLLQLLQMREIELVNPSWRIRLHVLPPAWQ